MLSRYGNFQNEEGGMKRFYKYKTKRLLMSTNVMVLQRKKNRTQGREGKKGKKNQSGKKIKGQVKLALARIPGIRF